MYKNVLLVVRDLPRSLAFYREVLGLTTERDFGANVTLTGGICLQTEESWRGFVDKRPEDLCYGGCVSEVYFEEAEFAAFLKRLEALRVSLVCPPLEHRWGQRVVRFYDPDGHVVEVGEPLSAVCRRFQNGGLSEEGIARRMEIPPELVRRCLREN